MTTWLLPLVSLGYLLIVTNVSGWVVMPVGSSSSSSLMMPQIVSLVNSKCITKMQADGRALTYAERLAQAKAAKGQTSAPPPPPLAGSQAPPPPPPSPTAPQMIGAARKEKPFTEEMYEEMREAILIITERMNRAAPITREECQRFGESVMNIMADAGQGVVRESKLTAKPTPPPPAVPAEQPLPVVPQVSMGITPQTTQFDDLATDGNNKFDGKYGVAVGTANTYVIEGMAGMNPDEYQEALRQKVLARARESRKNGVFGNISSNAYFDQLDPRTPKYKKGIPKTRKNRPE